MFATIKNVARQKALEVKDMNMVKLSEMRKRFWEEYYCKWEYYVEEIKQQPDLNDDVRNKALWGIEQVRKSFGDYWLKTAFEPPRHPSLPYMLNMAPWSRLWVFDFGKKISDFEGFPNFQELKKRLMKADQYGGAKTELDVAWIIRNNGFELDLVPRAPGKKKSCDIKTMIDKNDVYIEVTHLSTTEEERLASKTHDAIAYPYTFDRDVHISFRIHRILDESEIEDLRRKIERAIEKAKTTKRLTEVYEPDILDFCVVPRENHEELKEWQIGKNIHSSLIGPPIEIDKVGRIKYRIDKKSEQLPPNKPSIIVIDVTSSLSFFDRLKDYWSLAYNVDQRVFDHPNLIACIIQGYFHNVVGEDYSNEKRKVHRKGNYVLISRNDFSGEKAFLIIKNNYSRFKELNAKTEELFKEVLSIGFDSYFFI